jgi:hypothetical protein
MQVIWARGKAIYFCGGGLDRSQVTVTAGEFLPIAQSVVPGCEPGTRQGRRRCRCEVSAHQATDRIDIGSR